MDRRLHPVSSRRVKMTKDEFLEYLNEIHEYVETLDTPELFKDNRELWACVFCFQLKLETAIQYTKDEC